MNKCRKSKIFERIGKRSFPKKGQAAMEFLMTYGWAILVVLIAIGALAYFGVLNPGRFLPQKCTFGAGVSCGDFTLSAEDSTLIVTLQNSLGETVTLDTFVVVDIDTGAAITDDVTDDTSWVDGEFLDGDTTANRITLTDGTIATKEVGQRYRYRITIAYTGSSGLPHTIEGDVTGRVEA